MQIIIRLEKERRAVRWRGGIFHYDGSMDTCVAIRTLVMQVRPCTSGKRIVADSGDEFQETVFEAKALAWR
jgi:anthranilate synthase component 1